MHFVVAIQLNLNIWKRHGHLTAKLHSVIYYKTTLCYHPPTKLLEGNFFTGMCLSRSLLAEGRVGMPGPTSPSRGRYAWFQVPAGGIPECTKRMVCQVHPSTSPSPRRYIPTPQKVHPPPEGTPPPPEGTPPPQKVHPHPQKIHPHPEGTPIDGNPLEGTPPGADI